MPDIVQHLHIVGFTFFISHNLCKITYTKHQNYRNFRYVKSTDAYKNSLELSVPQQFLTLI